MERVIKSLRKGELIYYDQRFLSNRVWLIRNREGQQKSFDSAQTRPIDLTEVYQELISRNLHQVFHLVGKVMEGKMHYAVYQNEDGERRYVYWKYAKLFRLRAIVADEEIGAPVQPNERGLEFIALCKPDGLKEAPMKKVVF